MKQKLIKLLCQKSFQYSPQPKFRLVSGKMSKYYVNCKPVTLSPMGAFLIGGLMLETIADDHISAVGGLTFGADPIAMACAFSSYQNKLDKWVKAFSIRKTRKEHGTSQWIEGDIHPGERIAIIDDVATTGGSTVKAIQRARSENLEVVKAVILVDRQEGGLDNIRQHVDQVSAIISKDELMQFFNKETNE